MAKSNKRKARVADVIQAALAEILRKDAKNFRLGMVTVTSVEVAPDLSFAKIYVSVLEEATAIATVKTLNQEMKYFRHQLAGAVKLRATPELRFIYDDSVVRGNRITSLINNALKEK
jgi:ribosome-binding factor A